MSSLYPYILFTLPWEIWSWPETRRQIALPLCRELFVIPSGGFEKLPNNFFIEQLLEHKLKSVTSCVNQKIMKGHKLVTLEEKR